MTLPLPRQRHRPVCLGLTLLGLALALPGPTLRAELPAKPGPVAAASWDGAAGPWGRLRYSRSRLRTPAPTLATLSLPDASAWVFPDRDETGLDALLAAAPLPPGLRTRLRDPALRQSGNAAGAGVTLRLPPELRRELPAEARTYLYRELAHYPENAAQAFPFTLPPEDVLDRADFNPALRAAITRLTYQAGPMRLISDADLLAPLARDADELLQLKRALCTFETLNVEVLRPTPAEAAAMVGYWSPGGSPRTADVLRRFELSPDLATVGLANLLPPLPQALLNRFADGLVAPGKANCFWASLNFFRLQTNEAVVPTNDVADVSLASTMAELETHYTPVRPPYRLGDVICLTVARPDGDEVLVHMVAFVADGVVLTKHGAGELSPFMLTPLSAVIDYYRWPDPLIVHAFRPRLGSPALPDWR